MPFSKPRNIFPKLSLKVAPQQLEEFLSLEQVQIVTRVDGSTSLTSLAMLLRRPIDSLIADIKVLLLLDVLELYEHKPSTGTFEHLLYSVDDDIFSEFSQTLLPKIEEQSAQPSSSSLDSVPSVPSVPSVSTASSTQFSEAGVPSHNSTEAGHSSSALAARYSSPEMKGTEIFSSPELETEGCVVSITSGHAVLQEDQMAPEPEVVTYSSYSIASMDFVPEPEPLSRSMDQVRTAEEIQQAKPLVQRETAATKETQSTFIDITHETKSVVVGLGQGSPMGKASTPDIQHDITLPLPKLGEQNKTPLIKVNQHLKTPMVSYGNDVLEPDPERSAKAVEHDALDGKITANLKSVKAKPKKDNKPKVEYGQRVQQSKVAYGQEVRQSIAAFSQEESQTVPNMPAFGIDLGGDEVGNTLEDVPTVTKAAVPVRKKVALSERECVEDEDLPFCTSRAVDHSESMSEVALSATAISAVGESDDELPFPSSHSQILTSVNVAYESVASLPPMEDAKDSEVGLATEIDRPALESVSESSLPESQCQDDEDFDAMIESSLMEMDVATPKPRTVGTPASMTSSNSAHPAYQQSSNEALGSAVKEIVSMMSLGPSNPADRRTNQARVTMESPVAPLSLSSNELSELLGEETASSDSLSAVSSQSKAKRPNPECSPSGSYMPVPNMPSSEFEL